MKAFSNFVNTLVWGGSIFFPCTTMVNSTSPIVIRTFSDMPEIPAAPCPHINVCTFNIAHGRGLSAHQLFLREKIIKLHLKKIALFLRDSQIHVAALQEIDIQSFWNGNFEHATYLAEHIPEITHAAVGEHMSYKKLKYGTGIISSLPHSHSISRTFSSLQALPRKGFVLSEFSWPGDPDFHFDVISIHLDFISRRQRERQLEQLYEEVKSRKKPLILMGDLNSQWHDKKSAVRSLMNNLHLQTHAPSSSDHPTFRYPRRRWDWILLSDTFRFIDYRHGPQDLSDHAPVVARIVRNV